MNIKGFSDRGTPRSAFLLLCLAVALYIEVPYLGKPYIVLMPVICGMTFLFVLLRGKLTKDEVWLSLFALCLLVAMIIKAAYSESLGEHNYIYNILIFNLTVYAGLRVSPNRLAQFIKLNFYFTFMVFIFELYHRLSNPLVGGRSIDPDFAEGVTFYAYKINSLMYTNSNGVGMHALFMMSVLFAMYDNRLGLNKQFRQANGLGNKFLVFVFLVLSFFVFASFSRAAMLVLLVLALLFILNNSSKLTRHVVSLLAIVGVLFLLGFYYEHLLGDNSFITKIDIFENIAIYLTNASLLNIAFGNWLDEPSMIFPMFVGTVGHTHYFDIVFRLGLFVGSIYLVLISYAIVKTGKIGIYFLVVFVLLGSSNIRIFAHYLFFALGLIYVYRDQVKRFKNGAAC